MTQRTVTPSVFTYKVSCYAHGCDMQHKAFTSFDAARNYCYTWLLGQGSGPARIAYLYRSHVYQGAEFMHSHYWLAPQPTGKRAKKRAFKDRIKWALDCYPPAREDDWLADGGR